MRHVRVLRVLACSLALVAALPARVHAQDDGSAAGPDREQLREQSIYIPYEKLRDVFEKEGRGVFVSYERFRELWRLAMAKMPPAPLVKPPVAHVVTDVAGVLHVSGDAITARARIGIDLLREGWIAVPLRLGDVALTAARLGDAPARVTFEPGIGHRVLIEKNGSAPERVELDIEFAKAIVKAPGRNSVSFESPSAPLSSWAIHIPEAGVKVNVFPNLSVSETPGDQANETRVLAFVGAAPTVRLEWTPKAEGARGLEALASVLAEHQVLIEEGVTRCRTQLVYSISRAELAQLAIEVPANHKVVNVFDANVREWSVIEEPTGQRILVSLFEPARQTQRLLVELERFDVLERLTMPVARALGVGRQQGVVVVHVAPGLRAEVLERSGLLQIDATELPAALAQGRWEFSYRYAALPFNLVLGIEKVQPRILVETLVEAHLQPEALTLDLLAVCDIQRAGIFRLEFLLPDGFAVRSLAGLATGSAAAMDIESHRVLPGTPPRLVVNLARRAMNKAALAVQLHRSLGEADLLAPTGRTVAIAIPIPRVAPETIEREEGRVVLYAPDSLRVNPATSAGLRVISFDDAVSGLRSTREVARERPVLSYAYGGGAAALEVSAERRTPYVTVRQLVAARIDSGAVRFDVTLFADVQYSGVKALHLDLPEAIAGQVRIVTPGIRHVERDANALPTPTPDGSRAWSLAGETEFLGGTRIALTWEEKIDTLDIGQSIEVAIPRLVPRGVDRAWGQIVLAKAESIDVTPGHRREGLRAIDPRHDLMPGVRFPDAAQAFEFHDVWALDVKATRYEPKDVKATSIERALLRMVLTRSDVVSVQALYRMRSARQRLMLTLPDAVEFDTQPLRLDGRPVALEQGEANQYFVPLTGQNPETAFLLELRYTVRGGARRLAGPEFPMEPAVQQVFLSAYMPEELSYIGRNGPWNDELIWTLRGFSATPRARLSADWLVNWVCEGLSIEKQTLLAFATDGRHLLFSTLRPPPGASGALRVRAIPGWSLKAVVLVLLVGLGVLLLPASFARRAVALGVLLVVLVLLGVFLPSLARAVISNAAVGAALVVAVLWTLWFLLVTWPRRPRPGTAAPPPVPPGKTVEATSNADGQGGASASASQTQ